MTFRGAGAALILLLIAKGAVSCSSTANVSDVYMSLDEDGARRRTKFTTDTTSIYCVAQVGVGRPDVTVEMLVRQSANDPQATGELEGTNAVVAAIDVHPEITKDKPRLIQMKLVRTKPDETGKPKEDDETFFPAGVYRCEVKLDGQPAGSPANFTIDYPDCPTKVIAAGSDCGGFYPVNQQCPSLGATTDSPTCTCTGKGVAAKWVCGK